jgi:hypothetical protein
MKNKLLVVADLGLLKAYRLEFSLEHPPRLEQLEEVVLEDARKRVVDRVTDLAGRHVAPTQKKWGAPLTDDHNLKLESKRRLIHQIAVHIERLIQRYDHDSCWLAADKQINHQILKGLPPIIRDRIQRNLPHDLTKVEGKEVLDRFLKANA